MFCFAVATKLHRSYGDTINITGGGAYKFEPQIKNKLGFKVQKKGSKMCAANFVAISAGRAQIADNCYRPSRDTQRTTDEMTMAIKGLNFLVQHVPREVFTYKWDTNEQVFVDNVRFVGFCLCFLSASIFIRLCINLS